MENENVNQNQENEQNGGASENEQNSGGNGNEGGGEKTYTQAEVDKMIEKRLARERKNQPSEQELTEFREYQKTHKQKTDAEKVTELTGERDSAQTELEMARSENYLLKQGVDPEDVDYYTYKITRSMKEDEDFEDAAKAFLKDHKPRSSGGGVRFDTGGRLNGGGKKSENDVMNALIRGAAH